MIPEPFQHLFHEIPPIRNPTGFRPPPSPLSGTGIRRPPITLLYNNSDENIELIEGWRKGGKVAFTATCPSQRVLQPEYTGPWKKPIVPATGINGEKKETPATVRRWRGRLAERSLNRTRGAAFRQRKRKADSPPFVALPRGGEGVLCPCPPRLCASPRLHFTATGKDGSRGRKYRPPEMGDRSEPPPSMFLTAPADS